MRFAFPRFPAEFEIPDDWWHEAGMRGFVRRRSFYRSSTDLRVELDEIEPPFRLASTPKDWKGFERERLTRILKGFVAEDEIPPVSVLILPLLADISTAPFRYRVLDGVHRFYASIAAGFEQLPIVARKCFQ